MQALLKSNAFFFQIADHYLLRCSRFEIHRIALLLNLQYIICPGINVMMLRDLCVQYIKQNIYGNEMKT